MLTADQLVEALLEAEPHADSEILAAKKREYAKLDQEWDSLDNGDGSNVRKQEIIAKKMAKLWKDIDRWEKLYATCR